jgi:hypothetical protein
MEATDDYPLFRIGEAVRIGDPVTSVMAAESVAPYVTRGQMLALRAFYERRGEALDDFQLAEITGWRQTSVGKRRCELERQGYVLRGERRASPSGLTNSVVYSYEITDAGAAFYERESKQ